jgi:SAM-dependent methyltransferase
MWAAHLGDPRGFGVVERNDGYVEADNNFGYLAPIEGWLAHERLALDLAYGRCLDVGAGAGRVSLELQARGHAVVAVEPSTGAAAVCCDRGVRDVRVTTIERLPVDAGPFDSIVMYGNNLGLLRDARHAPWLLHRLGRLTSDAGLILGGCLDPYETTDPARLAYQAENRRHGRYPAQVRLRVRFRDKSTPCFDYLFVSTVELEKLLVGTGWRLHDVVRDIDGSPMYDAALEKM